MKRLQAVPWQERKVKVFISRLLPHTTEDDIVERVRVMTGRSCIVERVDTRYSTYASFVATVDKCFEDLVLDPDEWESDLLVRQFRGKLRRPQGPPVDRQNPNSVESSRYSVRDSWGGDGRAPGRGEERRKEQRGRDSSTTPRLSQDGMAVQDQLVPPVDGAVAEADKVSEPADGEVTQQDVNERVEQD